MDPKEVENKIKEFQSQLDTMKKDYELKLGSAQKDAIEWKENAEKREEDLRKFKEQSEKEKRDQAEKAKEFHKQEVKIFMETLVRDAKITPAQKMLLDPLMDSMSLDGEIAKFSEKDGSTKSYSQIALLKVFLSSLKKSVPYGEISSAGHIYASTPDNTDGDGGAQTFMDVRTEGTIQHLPVDDAELASKAFSYIEEQAKAGRKINYAQALIDLSPKRKISA